MARVEDIEQQLRELSLEELGEFREWFAEFDAEAWDRQLQSDVEAGKLDALAERALRARGQAFYEALSHHAAPDFWRCYEAGPPACGQSLPVAQS